MPADKRPITAEDLYALNTISDVRISPDGQFVVYAMQRVERKTEKKYTNLWIVPTRDGEPRQFTYGDQSDGHPRFSPDGKTIAFLSNRGDKEKPAQIYLIPLDGGEAHPLTSLEGEIGDFAWSPDGKRIVCQFRKTDEEALEREKDEQKKKLGVVDRHYTRLFYKLDGEGYLPKERWHIWMVDARTGKGKALTEHAVYDEGCPAWSPNGKWLAFVSNRSADPDDTKDADGLYIMPAAGGEIRQIPAPLGGKSLPSFSPDGKWLAYFGQEGEKQWYRNNGLWAVPADGSEAPRNLTEAYDLNCDAWVINDVGTPELMPPTWANDGKSIYFPIIQHGSSVLMNVQLAGGEPKAVVGEAGVVGSFTFDRTQQYLAYFYGKIDDPCQIYLREQATGLERPLTEINRELLDKISLGKVEEIWYKGPAGNDLQGWLLKPPGFDPSQKYPLILEIHGGPLAMYGWFFMHEFYYLAAQGYLVAFTNPRGGTGYGENHAKAIWGGWGDADYADLMAFSDLLSQQPFVDASRMGVTGGSYGGYMTVWIIGHTQRFRAAAAGRCVSNFVSMWGSSDFNWTFQEVLNDKPPFEDLQKYWDHSPIKYIGAAKTPTLVIHNEFDLRCPIEQGEQVFVALKRLGVDTEMVRFPNEFHGLSRNGRTDRRIARLKHISRWFNKYLRQE